LVFVFSYCGRRLQDLCTNASTVDGKRCSWAEDDYCSDDDNAKDASSSKPEKVIVLVRIEY